jgi:hypothetical protein
MSMSSVINSGRKGDGIYPANKAMSSKATKGSSGSPLSMSGSMNATIQGPSYNVTIAPNITVQSTGSSATDAHKIAKEVTALLDREIRLTLMRTS